METHLWVTGQQSFIRKKHNVRKLKAACLLYVNILAVKVFIYCRIQRKIRKNAICHKIKTKNGFEAMNLFFYLS